MTDDDLQKLQFDYAWKWFSYHADQRIKAFNYMMVTLGVLTTALLAGTGKVNPGVLAVLSLLSCMIALLFSRLDRRNRDLVWRGEDVLFHLERELFFKHEMKGRKGEVFRGLLLQDEFTRVKTERQAWVPKRNGATLDKVASLFNRVDTALDNQQSAWMLGKHRFIIPCFSYVFAIVYFIMFLVYLSS